MKSNQQGFTLIELVVVMVILGVLAATALPKFMNVSSQAHEAAVAGTGGSFGSAIAMAHAQWIAEGNVGATDDINYGTPLIDTNATGWPSDTAGGNGNVSTIRCENIWRGIMQNPPTADRRANQDPVYLVTRPNITTCTYTYTAVPTMSIT